MQRSNTGKLWEKWKFPIRILHKKEEKMIRNTCKWTLPALLWDCSTHQHYSWVPLKLQSKYKTGSVASCYYTLLFTACCNYKVASAQMCLIDLWLFCTCFRVIPYQKAAVLCLLPATQTRWCLMRKGVLFSLENMLLDIYNNMRK